MEPCSARSEGKEDVDAAMRARREDLKYYEDALVRSLTVDVHSQSAAKKRHQYGTGHRCLAGSSTACLAHYICAAWKEYTIAADNTWNLKRNNASIRGGNNLWDEKRGGYQISE